MNILNPLDPTTGVAVGPAKIVPPNKTPTTYNNPGLPTPAMWGKVSSDALAPDTCAIPSQ